ncbi:hypothetical protein EPI10_015904 [Gossypium australe]|uniref:Uncharacterized protein n=1 Tax=Gossypium australe TaxID=47621 RepID=A0A5B6VMG9_9ROSI|nr:hypothetical protein EPI10_015904 [Gossypium australe]
MRNKWIALVKVMWHRHGIEVRFSRTKILKGEESCNNSFSVVPKMVVSKSRSLMIESININI